MYLIHVKCLKIFQRSLLLSEKDILKTQSKYTNVVVITSMEKNKRKVVEERCSFKQGDLRKPPCQNGF